MFLIGAHFFIFWGDSMQHDMEINKRIKNLRLAKKITQEEIATYLGIKISSYSQMERKGVFSAERLALIADYFNVDYNYLLVGKEPDPKHLDTNDILFICDCIHKEFEKHYRTRYCVFDALSDQELTCLRMITLLKKKERFAVYDYAAKLFHNKIQID